MFTQEEQEIIEGVVHTELQMIWFMKGFGKKSKYEESLKKLLKKIQLLQKPKSKAVNKLSTSAKSSANKV